MISWFFFKFCLHIQLVPLHPGATADDPEDGDLTDDIDRDASALDTTTPGGGCVQVVNPVDP